ncbi:Patatin [hydrothermal vent metagenome]|uniref:Patatin n=1 Tax=hydrothermal vent metagenome TaxID=652676 RepID=A0A3B1C5M4_9ZZZZ
MNQQKSKTSIILSGGGARAAYQVGVLRAIAEMLPDDAQNPFDIVCGTSAGAINAAALATHAYNFNKSVQRIHNIWSNFHAQHVFKTDSWSLLKTSANWFLAMLSAGLNKRHGSLSLLDRSPLEKLLKQYIHSEDIQYSIDQGYLHALSITASGYSSQQSVSFFHADASQQPWSRSRRIGARAKITVTHLMASSAIPFIFAPVRLNREFFGDGSMRQIAPISPALHLGADKILIIGNRQEILPGLPRHRYLQEPSIAQVAGHALDSIFLDSLSADIERLQRINKTIEIIPEETRIEHGIELRKVEVLVISPSRNLGELALEYLHELPTSLRFLLKSIGAYSRNSSGLASYLLFEKGYCQALIELGYQDSITKSADIIELLSPQSRIKEGNTTR